MMTFVNMVTVDRIIVAIFHAGNEKWGKPTLYLFYASCVRLPRWVTFLLVCMGFN